jgi:site-specific DNA-methyltransferase (adenine-specific)
MTITNEDNMTMMSRYPDNYFDLAIVDPPYGIGEDGKKNHSRGKFAKPKKFLIKEWDNKTASKEYFKELFRVSKNCIIWGANHFFEKINKNSSCWVVWDKKNGNTDFADCELAFTTFKTAVRKFEFRWNGMLQEDMKNKEFRIHPTQKPAKLYEWLLTNYAQENEKILDTHLGSGSIAIACHNLHFDLTACELDKDYFDAAMKRINNHKKQLRLF